MIKSNESLESVLASLVNGKRVKNTEIKVQQMAPDQYYRRKDRPQSPVNGYKRLTTSGGAAL